MTLTLDSDPEEVSIGQPGDHPERESTFRLRDYHALAVRDLNSDERPDLLALGGGLRGRAAELVPGAREALFLSTPAGRSFVLGPPKNGCAARSAWWEDDALRVTCGRGQADQVWVPTRVAGGGIAWRGGHAEASIAPPDRRRECTESVLVREGRVHPAEEAICAEGDFDSDGTLELAVATPRDNKVSTATLYDPTP